MKEKKIKFFECKNKKEKKLNTKEIVKDSLVVAGAAAVLGVGLSLLD